MENSAKHTKEINFFTPAPASKNNSNQAKQHIIKTNAIPTTTTKKNLAINIYKDDDETNFSNSFTLSQCLQYGFTFPSKVLYNFLTFTFNQFETLYNGLKKPVYFHGYPLPIFIMLYHDHESLIRNKMVKYWLSSGHDPNSIVYYTDTIEETHTIAQFLSPYSITKPTADVDGKIPALKGTTLHILLHESLKKVEGATTFVNIVYGFGKSIDLTIQDNHGQTIIVQAVSIDADTFLTNLFKNVEEEAIKNAINIPDNNGKTPLDYALQLGNKEMIQLLKAHGAVESSMNQNEVNEEKQEAQQSQSIFKL